MDETNFDTGFNMDIPKEGKYFFYVRLYNLFSFGFFFLLYQN